MYIDYDFYASLYGNKVDPMLFNRCVWGAEKLVRDATTGVDGRCKLDIAFPDIPSYVEATKRCICALVDSMARIEMAETEANSNKVVKSVSAGNESITYETNVGIVASVVSDKSKQAKLHAEIIDDYLRGVKDKNGVNLLYRGIYPYLMEV